MQFVKNSFKEIVDFLFFNYSHVQNSKIIFESFKDVGAKCEFVTEKDIHEWQPDIKKQYNCVVVYLHEPDHLEKINGLLDNSSSFKKSFLIQHDDTDEPNVQNWTNRKPDLVMQRELWKNSKNPRGIPAEPFHFPIPSVYDESFEQVNDVMFYGCPNSDKRILFVEKIQELANGSLKNLKWDISIDDYDEIQKKKEHTNGGATEEYIRAINQCKVALHYFGNSRDSIRIWEAASTKAALVMPKMRTKSVSDEYMPFKDYTTINDDMSDLEHKILYTLDNWENIGRKSQTSFKNRHSPQHVCQKYRDIVQMWMGPKWRNV
jgi:hypothetical protein